MVLSIFVGLNKNVDRYNMKKTFIIALAALSLASCTYVKAPSGSALFDHFTYDGTDSYYEANPLPSDDCVYNPVLPGWYSDPSICTNGKGDYFMVTSTFSYYPGVPIFHSRDLVNWEQIGHVLDRPSQLGNLVGQLISEGIYAPDIQYNSFNETYYLVTTDVNGDNFFVKTKDPWQGWSDPVALPEIEGIDPSFFFDEDGRAYIMNNDDAPGAAPEYDGHRTIRCVEFDVESEKCIGERKIIVNKGAVPADKPVWIEGPHMYKVNGKYLLMCAEGGTEQNHSEVVFSGDSPMGPFTAWSGNPILTQRDLPEDRENPVTCTGHADIIQGPDGQWWAVFLGCRPINGVENLGRETFMVPFTWSADGFPVIIKKGETVPMIVKHEGTKRSESLAFGNFGKVDEFDSDKLGLEWMTLRGPGEENYSLTETPGFLTLRCSADKSSELGTPSLVLRRIQHHSFEASTRMYFTPEKISSAAGMLVFKDEKHQYFLRVNSETVSLLKVEFIVEIELGGMGAHYVQEDEVLATAPLGKHKFIDLKTVSDGAEYTFYYSVDGKEWQELISGVEAKYVSNAYTGGFTGATIGLYAVK